PSADRKTVSCRSFLQCRCQTQMTFLSTFYGKGPLMRFVPAQRSSHADEVRTLARHGVLATTVAGAGVAERGRLTSGTYDIAWPVVFTGLTQGLERRRGHSTCATSVRHLADDCLDRFEDDVEAVVHDVMRFAHKPINNLEAWIGSRLNAATVD